MPRRPKRDSVKDKISRNTDFLRSLEHHYQNKTKKRRAFDVVENTSDEDDTSPSYIGREYNFPQDNEDYSSIEEPDSDQSDEREQPLPSDVRISGYEDIYDSSCDEVEVEDMFFASRLKRTPTSTEPSTSSGFPAVSDILTIRVRKQLEDALFIVKRKVRTWTPGDGEDPYPSKICFGCNWEMVSIIKEHSSIIREFLNNFQKGVSNLRNLELHCHHSHLLFKQLIYPNMHPRSKRIWRSWQIRHHLLHHTTNAHVMHYRMMQMARTHVEKSFNDMYGPESLHHRAKGRISMDMKWSTIQQKQSQMFTKAQSHLLHLYKIKPSTLSFNASSSFYDTENSTPSITSSVHAAYSSLIEKEGGKNKRLALTAPESPTLSDNDEDVIDA